MALQVQFYYPTQEFLAHYAHTLTVNKYETDYESVNIIYVVKFFINFVFSYAVKGKKMS